MAPHVPLQNLPAQELCTCQGLRAFLLMTWGVVFLQASLRQFHCFETVNGKCFRTIKHCIAGFLNLGAADALSQTFPCWGGVAWVSHAMQSVEQYPQPLPTSYDHFPPVMTTHNVSRYCQISPRVGSKIAPHWDGVPYRNVRQDIFHHGT